MAELITLILLTATALFIGIFIGWMMANHAELDSQDRLQTLIAVVITLGWIASTIAGILITAYTVSPLLHALMGGIVGYFFTEEGLTFNIGGK